MPLNQKAVDHAETLITTGKVVRESDWHAARPSADEMNRVLEQIGLEEYQKWFLRSDSSGEAVTPDDLHFLYGDFDAVHRSALISLQQYAISNRHDDIKRVVDRLIIKIDKEPDSVEIASDDSFPASDPPGWRDERLS